MIKLTEKQVNSLISSAVDFMDIGLHIHDAIFDTIRLEVIKFQQENPGFYSAFRCCTEDQQHKIVSGIIRKTLEEFKPHISNVLDVWLSEEGDSSINSISIMHEDLFKVIDGDFEEKD